MILNRHKRHQALLRIIACTIISVGEIKDPEALDKMIGNLADLAYYVGGINGMHEVADKAFEKDKENNNENIN